MIQIGSSLTLPRLSLRFIPLLLLILFCMVEFSRTCNAQEPSLLKQLEQESGPIQKSNGAVETDIHPEDVIHWTLAGHDFNETSKILTLTIQLTTEQQFTIYEDKLKFEPSRGWKITSRSPPPTTTQFDPISQKDVQVYTKGAFNLTMVPTEEVHDASIQLTYVGCTKVICLFPHSESIPIPGTYAATSGTTPSAKPAADSSQITGSNGTQSDTIPKKDPGATPTVAPSESPSKSSSVEEVFASRVNSGDMSFAMLLLIAFVGGLLTNLTPCVAPMIPITIRLLANQTARPIASAAMYASGIVATYTSLGVVAALSGALFGNLIAHPAVSITFGLVMFLLGLNMLGFGDLTKLQQIGGRIGSSKGGIWNSFLMGAGAGLVASPCTGPILAALLTYTAGRQNTGEAISLLGIYSIGFALPYVFLGASAAKISKRRVSFHVQILTKLVFASVMFALSLYFLRLPLYGVFNAMRPYWGHIGIAGFILGLTGSAIIIFKESLHHNKLSYLVPTLTLGFGLFFGIQALTRDINVSSESIQWLATEKEAVEAATKEGKPILADAWAEWCEACKKMDATTYKDPEVVEEIQKNWIALKFDLTEINDENNRIQDAYQLPGLPTTTLLPMTGDLKDKSAMTGYTSAASLLEKMKAYRAKLNAQTR